MDNLILGTTASSRRKGYGVLGVASNSGSTSGGDRRNITEFVPVGLNEKKETRVSSSLSGRTLTNEGLRREEVHSSRSRTSSVGDEIYVFPHTQDFMRCVLMMCRNLNGGEQMTIYGLDIKTVT